MILKPCVVVLGTNLPVLPSRRKIAVFRDRRGEDVPIGFENRLGKMKLVGKRYPYPLVAVHADKFATTRFALIGDAAVGMHPVTAHGFNLGLRGQATLAKEIKSAMSQGRDIGTLEVLEKYQSKHMQVTNHYTWGQTELLTCLRMMHVQPRFCHDGT